MSWDNDYKLSLDARQYQDKIYTELFNPKQINRFDRDDKNILDIQFHIDVEILLQNNTRLLGQEKALRYEFSKFNTFTIEFYQDRHNKTKGEFFHIASQFYLHGYWNESYTGLGKWYLIKMFDFINWLRQKPIEELEKQTRPSTSKANFFYMNYNDIPEEFIYKKLSN
jgi:hypothetical protein